MSACRFYHPIEVRYGDLDPQGHVNNARYLTYMEQARIAYIAHLGLWKGISFLDIGVILADVHLTFKSPIQYGQQIRVGVQVTRLGNKSFTIQHSIEDTQTSEQLAACQAILVAYDYRRGRTVPIPDQWRETLAAFEGLT
ncbi:MAG: acyl-CoA thioesterase [Anaerolineales bacterium]|nr:acyl-CoA thioesterase [Anaerolineales bacterium]